MYDWLNFNNKTFENISNFEPLEACISYNWATHSGSLFQNSLCDNECKKLMKKIMSENFTQILAGINEAAASL